MRQARRSTLKVAVLALAIGGLGLATSARSDDDDDDEGLRSGMVFTSTNAVTGNEVLVYASPDTSGLAFRTRVATRGTGTGGGLGNQGAVTLSRDGRHLFVVNARSNNVTTFAVRRRALAWMSTTDAGGLQPVSVTEHHGIVYVLNANGPGNVTGFRNVDGVLTALPGSTQPLSATTGTGPAQVGFDPEGEVLLVTEKATNKLTSYRVV